MNKIILLALFIVVAFSDICDPPIDNCIECSFNGKSCTKCDESNFYFLNSEKKCVHFQGCENYSSYSDKCTLCKSADDYFPNKNIGFTYCIQFRNCKIAPEVAEGNDQACIKCKDALQYTHSIQEGQCLKTCKPHQKHYLDKSGCMDDPNKVNGIQRCTAQADPPNTNTQCKICVAGNSLSESKTQCISHIKNCEIYSNGSCKTCKNGFKWNTETTKCDNDDSKTSSASINSVSITIVMAIFAILL